MTVNLQQISILGQPENVPSEVIQHNLSNIKPTDGDVYATF